MNISGDEDDPIELEQVEVKESLLPPPIDLSKVSRKIFNISAETVKSGQKYETAKDILVDARTAWEELLIGLKDSKSLDRFMMPAARMAALLIVMIHKFGDRDYKPFLDYLEKDLYFEIPERKPLKANKFKARKSKTKSKKSRF